MKKCIEKQESKIIGQKFKLAESKAKLVCEKEGLKYLHADLESKGVEITELKATIFNMKAKIESQEEELSKHRTDEKAKDNEIA